MEFNMWTCIITLWACIIICKCSSLSSKLYGRVFSGKHKIWVLAYKREVIQFCTTQIKPAMLNFRCIYSSWYSALDTKALRRKESCETSSLQYTALITINYLFHKWLFVTEYLQGRWRLNLLLFAWEWLICSYWMWNDVKTSRIRPFLFQVHWVRNSRAREGSSCQSSACPTGSAGAGN